MSGHNGKHLLLHAYVYCVMYIQPQEVVNKLWIVMNLAIVEPYSLALATHTSTSFSMMMLFRLYFDVLHRHKHIAHVQTHNHIQINCVYHTFGALIWLLFACTVFSVLALVSLLTLTHTLWTLEFIIIYFWYIILLRPHNSRQSYRHYDSILLAFSVCVCLFHLSIHVLLTLLIVYIFRFEYVLCSRICKHTHVIILPLSLYIHLNSLHVYIWNIYRWCYDT